MVAPVPSLDVVTGKFLVVTVIGLITGLLNVVSVGASVRVIQVDESIHVPVSALLIILAAIIPLSMLFSAILIAVCSFARSFKESQNYVMPVVICAMVPAVMGAMPGAKLSGAARVVPVENIVLLVRDLVTRDTVPWGNVLIVLLSTGLYAGGAIGVASRLFGHEAVSFADAGSYRTLFRRDTFRPAGYPSAAQALLTVAIVFPVWFYVQGVIASATESGGVRVVRLDHTVDASRHRAAAVGPVGVAEDRPAEHVLAAVGGLAGLVGCDHAGAGVVGGRDRAARGSGTGLALAGRDPRDVGPGGSGDS